jgi:lysophospholipase L1-like esterase
VLTVLAFGLTGPTETIEAADRSAPSLLALGDSIAFGWTARSDHAVAPDMIGYPDLAAHRLHLADVNLSCPGQATGGFISLSGNDNGCWSYRAESPLHVAYQGTQLAAAAAALRSHRQVRVISITLGANDYLHLRAHCLPTPGCYQEQAPAMLAAVTANLDAILGALRGTGYRGIIAMLAYYALIDDAAGVVQVDALNHAIAVAARRYDAVVVDGMQAFGRAAGSRSYCAAGFLAPTWAGNCDIHPSVLGRSLLATALVDAVRGAGGAVAGPPPADRSASGEQVTGMGA